MFQDVFSAFPRPEPGILTLPRHAMTRVGLPLSGRGNQNPRVRGEFDLRRLSGYSIMAARQGFGIFPSIGIVGAYGQTGQGVLWAGLPYASKVVSGREVCRQRLLGGPYVFGSQTSVLFRSDLVRSRDPFYNESNLHAADSEACFEFLKGSDFGFVYQVLTFSRERDGSLLQASKELNASAADRLHELVAYGPCYLTADEHAECLDTNLSKYYEFLATSLLQWRGKGFWDYHKARLKADGIGFSYVWLAGAVSRKVLDRFRVPKRESRQWGL